MLTAVVIGGLLLSSAANSPGQVTVAVSACITGPEVPPDLSRTVSQLVVTALRDLESVRLLDRTQTSAVVQEQDLILVSQAADVLRKNLGPAGADQLLVVSLANITGGFVFGLRLIDVAAEEVLGSMVEIYPSERQLIEQCPRRTKSFWQSVLDGARDARAAPRSDDALEALWRLLNESSNRELLGPELERAESVYRQYLKAVQEGRESDQDRLSRLSQVYLADCLSLLQRVQNPPPGMVFVPAGWVTVSLSSGKTRRFWVPAFFVDRCETTRAEYSRFLKASGRREPPGWTVADKDVVQLPATGIDWYNAEAAAAWRGLRLPTRLQHLRALRGDRGHKYPWGDMWRPEFCTFARDPKRILPEAAGSKPQGASCWGVLDGVGGVAEWLETWQGSDYWAHAPERNPPGPISGQAKLAVGGSYRSGPGNCSCESTEALAPGTRRDDLGFRCVLTVNSGGAGG